MKKKRKLKKETIIFILLLIMCSIIVLGLFYFKNKEDRMKYLANLYFEGLNENQEIGKSNSDISYKLGCSHVIKYPKIGQSKIDKQIRATINKMKDNFQKEFGNNKDFNGIEKISYYQYIDYETYLAPDNTMSLILNETKISEDSNVISEMNYVYNYSIDSGELLKNSYIFVGDYKRKITDYLEKYLTSTKKYEESLNSDYKNVINDKTNYKYAINNDGIKIYFDKYEICSGNKGLIKINIPYNEIKGVMNININNKTKKLKPNTGAKVKSIYTSSNKKMYIKSLVNFYKKADKNSKLIGNISKGERVICIEIGDNGWTKISYNNINGYVSSSLLSEKTVAVEGYTDVNEIVYTISETNIRKKADGNSEKLGTLKKADSITRVGKSDSGWSEVIYNDNIAYIYSSYLSTTKPSDTNFNINIDPQKGIDPNKPMVALTFDDGPNPYSTPRILKTLAKYNVSATFFDLGPLIYTYSSIVKQEEAQGCEVGSHTYNHSNLNNLSVQAIKDDMNKSDEAFVKVLGHKPNLVRTPYGNANSTVRSTIQYPIINWDIDTEDWKSRNKDSILTIFRNTNSYDGKIILMHSIYGTTADAVEVMVPELISKGYQLVTVSELAAYKGVKLQAGKVYFSF